MNWNASERRKHPAVIPALGFVVGALGSWAYRIWGSWGWILPEPLWAKVVLYPGVFNASLFLDRVPGATLIQAEAVGIVTMGLVGAGLGWLLHCGLRRRARH